MAIKSQWWVYLLLIISVLILVLLPTAALGYKFDLLNLQLAFNLLYVVVIGGALILVLIGITVFISSRRKLKHELRLSIIALLVVVLPLGVMGYQIVKAFGVPPIHDITTDTDNPPVFDRAVGLRGERSNTLDYGTESLPAEKLAALQRAAYPHIKTVHSDLAPDLVFDRMVEIIGRNNHELITKDKQNGLIEAVSTSFWFGFKDDLVIRIQATQNGSSMDIRSVSRVGQSDLGANAARIAKLVKDFNSGG
ncbi:MAG: DUF1499 domain-containing protein [Gammaproteobacteria bacterium]|nr:DUF1499 domain-containing protein [Gammaproteobacteria bacterium]